MYECPAKIAFSWIEGAMKTSCAGVSWTMSCKSASSMLKKSDQEYFSMPNCLEKTYVGSKVEMHTERRTVTRDKCYS